MVKPEFELNDANSAAVGTIVDHLDGLPLAIELAAPRLLLLPPKALAARLERRLPLLGDGASDRPERQQTMHGAIAWSYDLLSDSEQRLIQAFGRAAGRRYARRGGCRCRRRTRRTLDSLSARAARREKHALAGRRCRCGAARLDARDAARVRARTARRKRRARRRATSPCRVRAAIYRRRGTAVNRVRDKAAGSRTWSATTRTSTPRSSGPQAAPQTEIGFQLLERAVAILVAARPSHRRHSAGFGGFLALRKARAADRARRLVRQGAARSRGAAFGAWELRRSVGIVRGGDRAAAPDRRRRGAWRVAHVARRHSASFAASTIARKQRIAKASRSGGESVTRPASQPRYRIYRRLHTAKNDLARAASLADESVAIYRRLGHESGLAHALMKIGLVAAAEGEYARAEELFNECLRMQRAIGNTGSIMYSLVNLGAVAHKRGNDGSRSSATTKHSICSTRCRTHRPSPKPWRISPQRSLRSEILCAARVCSEPPTRCAARFDRRYFRPSAPSTKPKLRECARCSATRPSTRSGAIGASITLERALEEAREAVAPPALKR